MQRATKTGNSTRERRCPVLVRVDVKTTMDDVIIYGHSRLKGRLSTCLLLAGILAGCASQPQTVLRQTDLQYALDEAVPVSWRAAAEQYTVIDPLAIDEKLREFVRSTAQPKASQRSRILALTDAIIDKKGVGLIYDAGATHTAVEAFESGRGNCLGFANLLIATAREAGVKTKFELVSNFQNWEKHGDLVITSLHVRVVAFASGRRMIFDFHPQPVRSGSWQDTLTDLEALSHHLNNLAVRSMQNDDASAAYAKLRTAIEISPHIGFLWSNLGSLLVREGMTELAETTFQEALHVTPDWAPAVANLQSLYTRLGRTEDAEVLALQIERHRERNPYYQFWLGQVAFDSDRYADAVRHYRSAIRLKKDDREFYFRLADAYTQLGDDKAARYAKAKGDKVGAAPISTETLQPMDR